MSAEIIDFVARLAAIKADFENGGAAEIQSALKALRAELVAMHALLFTKGMDTATALNIGSYVDALNVELTKLSMHESSPFVERSAPDEAT